MLRFARMNLREYREQVGLANLGDSLGALLDQVVARYQVSAQFNLVKFRMDELKLSFLSYPDFETDPHAALRHAITIDLATERRWKRSARNCGSWVYRTRK
jgi:hypothetical protein